jgi:YggT family protein
VEGRESAGGDRSNLTQGKALFSANRDGMGVTATAPLLADAIDQAKTFVNVFITVYTLVIFAYIITSWLRLPYSPTLNRIQRFLYDVSEPYLRLFRRVLPPMGALDLSPMIGIIVLIVIDRALEAILDQFH